MKRKIICLDQYEAEKFASLIFIKDGKETFIIQILNVVDNEIVVKIKDKSAHSILLKDKAQVESFADFIQSVFEKKHKIIDIVTSGKEVEIIKE